MQLNSKGTANVVKLTIIFVLGLLIIIFVSIFISDAIYLLGLLTAYIWWYYWDLKSDLKTQLLSNIYRQISFKRSSINPDAFRKYRIGQRGTLYIEHVWKGVIESEKITFFEFDINRGFKQKDWLHRFIGAEIPTANNNVKMQIYNRKNPMVPWFKNGIVLESVDFRKHFKVIADENITAFRQLSPSAMDSLLRQIDSAELPVNIEFTEKSILVYTSRKYFDKLFNKLISYGEIFNEEIDPSDIEIYRVAILKLHQLCRVAFKALEVQAVKSIKNKKSL